MTLYPGDPLTPGVGATADAKRLSICGFPGDPEDSGAADFLWRRAALPCRSGRPVVPPAWRGALPITYHIGGGDGARCIWR